MSTISVYPCLTPFSQTVSLNLNQILYDQTYRGCWPKKTRDMVTIVASMVVRVCDRCDPQYHKFLMCALNMFAQASSLQTGQATPRAVAGNFVVLNYIFKSLDDVVAEDAIETLLESINRLVEQYVQAVVQMNAHNLHGAIAEKRRKHS